MDLVLDRRHNSMVVMFASQVLGKTTMIGILIGWNIEHGPGGGVMVIQPTIAMAVSWSKLKLAPLLSDIEHESKEETTFSVKGAGAESTVQLKTWPGGYLVCGGANSPAPLAMYSCRYLFADEVDRYPPTVATRGNVEGDPISVAKRRTESYADAFVVYTSTPTTKGVSRIEIELELTDYRKWHVTCTRCAHSFVILWQHIKWAKDEAGRHLTSEAFLECPGCGAHLSDTDRRSMVSAGHWVATRPQSKRAGYWANAFISLLPHKRSFASKLHEWAQEFLEAKAAGDDTYRAFVNQVFCESYEEPAEKPTAPGILYERREHYFEGDRPTLPEGVLVLTLGADKQVNRIETTLIGWGKGEESWVLEHRVWAGEFERKEFREQMAGYLGEKYYTAGGAELTVASACFDAGDRPQSIHQFCREMRHKAVWAIRGRGGMDMPWIVRPKSAGRNVTLHVDAGKAAIMSRMTLVEPGPGRIHFCYDQDLEYFRQLTSEHMVAYVSGGQTYKRFELTGRSRNEALDCFVYAYAALGLLGRVVWDTLEKRLKAAEGKKPDAPPESPMPPMPNKPQWPPMPPAPVRQRPRITFGRW